MGFKQNSAIALGENGIYLNELALDLRESKGLVNTIRKDAPE